MKPRTGGPQADENVYRPDVPRTLRDDLLLKQCEEIKSKYLAPFHAKLAAVQADFQSASKQACFSSCFSSKTMF